MIGGAFDSLLAKLIVWGESRDEALARSRRALAEFQLDGLATALPFHRAVVSDPAFAPAGGAPFTVHTRWIETEFVNEIAAFAGTASAEGPEPREVVVVEVGGKRLEVSLPAGFGGSGGGAGASRRPAKRSAARKAVAAVSGDALTAPMQGTIVKVEVADGDVVEAGSLIVVLEAMKMEQPLTAHKAGTITALSAEVGAVVSSGSTICEIKD